MFDITYRFDPDRSPIRELPVDADEARTRLEQGNKEYASILARHLNPAPGETRVIYFDLADIGISLEGGAPKQAPFAVVVGCSDARVPIELIFNRASNELFVIRVAGNLLGQEGLGSIDYALQNLGESLKLVVVLGHSQCGAVTAAVDAFLQPSTYLALSTSHSLRTVVNGVLPAVRAAAVALKTTWGADAEVRPGYREALIYTAIPLNAALTAAMVQQEFETGEAGPRVLFSVYDLESRRVGVAIDARETDEIPVLMPPPQGREGFEQFGKKIAELDVVKNLLNASS